MLVLGVDPGETFGVALIRAPMKCEYAAQIKPTQFREVCEQLRPNIVVFESFLLYPSTAASLSYSSLRTAGYCQHIQDVCKDLGIKVTQQPAAVRNRITNELLKAAKVYRTSSPHLNDALRHALFYLWFTRGYSADVVVEEVMRSVVPVPKNVYDDSKERAQDAREMILSFVKRKR